MQMAKGNQFWKILVLNHGLELDLELPVMQRVVIKSYEESHSRSYYRIS